MRAGATGSTVYFSGSGLTGFALRQVERLGGLALLAAAAACVGALATWNVADPSFSHSTDNPVTNALGYGGAVYSDLAMQFFGLSALVTIVPLVAWGLLFATARGVDRMPKRGLAWFGAAVLIAGATGCIAPTETWPLPAGLGGVAGDVVLKLPGLFIGGYPRGLAAMVILPLLAAPGLYLLAFASGVLGREIPWSGAEDDEEFDDSDFVEDDEEEGRGTLAIGAVTHWFLSARAFVRRHTKQRHPDPMDEMPLERASAAAAGGRVEPAFGDFGPAPEPRIDEYEDDYEDAAFEDEDIAPARSAQPRPAARVDAPAPRPQQGSRVRREAQVSMLASDSFEMPPIHFLAEPKNVVRDASLSKEALERTRGCWRACWRISASRARSSPSGPALSSHFTSWSPRPASSLPASSAWPTTSRAR